MCSFRFKYPYRIDAHFSTDFPFFSTIHGTSILMRAAANHRLQLGINQ